MASGSVYRRYDRKKPWIVHVSWLEGNRRRQAKRAFATKKEAQVALAELLSSHENQSFVPRTGITVEEYAKAWLEGLAVQGRKVSTIRGYTANLRNYIVPNLGTIKLQDLRASDLDRLYAHLLKTNGKRGKPISKTTVHHVHVQLGKMLTDAERKGLVIRNVARLADAPSQASSRNAAPEMKVWTPAELQRFLTYAGEYRAGPMPRLMAMTGIRRGELVALGWKNADLSRGTIDIHAAASVIDRVEVLDTPKTRRGRRTIDLDRETKAVLNSQRSRRLAAPLPDFGPRVSRAASLPMAPRSIGVGSLPSRL